MIHITKDSESYIHVECDEGIAMELADRYTFYVDGYRFMPAYRKGFFDGKIRLFDMRRQRILAGLRQDLEEFAMSRGYPVTHGSDFASQEFSEVEALEFIKTLNLPENMTPREHQVRGFIKAVRNKRMLMLSPTNSGEKPNHLSLARIL